MARMLSHNALADRFPSVRGKARVDTRTKRLALRILPGEIAVINHLDLDLPCAQALLARRVAAVINAQAYISGRYPSLGPGLLLQSGIILLESVGPEILTALTEGEEVEIIGEAVFSGGKIIGRGTRLTPALLQEKIAQARANLGEQLNKFVQNTLALLGDEQRLLYDAAGIPPLRTDFTGRQALIVVRGEDAAADLRTIRSYIRERQPVLVAVDGGADLLLGEGLKPDIIIGDMDSVSDAALGSGAELVVHAYADGRAPGRARLENLGLEAKIFSSLGTSEDIALLLAYEKEAELIVSVGTHFSLIEFLEKARGGMASTFLVRLKVGEKLVDAKGLSRLYPEPLPMGYLLILAGVALIAILLLATRSPQVQAALEMLALRLRTIF
jgi:uncharacterized membrane-anchored protein